jgi:hypothetical protein
MMRWEGHVAHMGKIRNAHKILAQVEYVQDADIHGRILKWL